ncbi:MAG: phosphoenolpyruvate synthase [Bdellovibrionota bacterium]
MIITRGSTESFARKNAGGKGYNLYLLTKAGFEVPPWVVINANVFLGYCRMTGIGSKISSALAGLGPQTERDRLIATSETIYDLITSTPLPSEIDNLARKAYINFSGSPIAVRSSAADEDSAKHSFAGQLSSFLFVNSVDNAIASLKKCWASAYSERGLAYRIQNKIALDGPVAVAVIFQKMISSEKSGVMFTCDPIREDGTRVMINSVYGIGEGLVSGLLDADTFVIDKKTGATLSKEIASKKTQLVHKSLDDGLVEAEVNSGLIDAPSLNEDEIQELLKLGRNIETFYGFPQDVEWGWCGGKFYLLQSRPVTTPVKNCDGLLHIWDNSNIIESYGGITMPLTFTFARHVYHWVYIQFCEILLVPQREIRKMDYFLRNMLGLFYGKVYYNLLNWYKLTSILPGFKYNRQFMETMMGTSEGLADEIADRIKPPGFHEKLSSKIRRFITGAKFFYFHLTIQSMVNRFLSYFHKVYGRYRRIDYNRIPADRIFTFYQQLEQELLLEWKAPIINDYLCMVHFGLLKKLTQLWLPAIGDSLQNDLLCGEGNLESAEPTRELIRMADEVKRDPGLRELIENTQPQDCLEALLQSPFTAFAERVNRYIDLYGFRCMNEMKLEEIDLYQDPSFLFVCLNNYLKSGQTDLEVYEKREREIRASAEARVRANLHGPRRLIYLWSLKHARKAVKNRENTRFCRTRIYGVARAMFYGIGKDFTARGILDRAEDIFYLELDELAGAIQGTLTTNNLKALARLREKEYLAYEAVDTAPRFLTRGPVYWMNEHTPQEADKEIQAEDLPENCLKGIGCCPGIIEGSVKLILSSKDDMRLNGEVLVTLRTDPGWIPLYPSASALLVERGGLLSHSAIVAREMGLPTIVGIKGLTRRLKPGDKIRMNGETGIVEILES